MIAPLPRFFTERGVIATIPRQEQLILHRPHAARRCRGLENDLVTMDMMDWGPADLQPLSHALSKDMTHCIDANTSAIQESRLRMAVPSSRYASVGESPAKLRVDYRLNIGQDLAQGTY